jgi:hypothetical protein
LGVLRLGLRVDEVCLYGWVRRRESQPQRFMLPTP